MRADRGSRTSTTAGRATEPLELLVDALATYRLTRLATADVISEDVRLAVLGRLGLGRHDDSEESGGEPTAEEIVGDTDDPPKLATLVTCRWCAGVWIAGGVALARTRTPRAWSPVARALALSAAAALLAGLEDD